LSLETGLRISDILKLKTKDVSILLRVRESKTKKWKTVKLSENLYTRLKAYASNSDNIVFKSLRKPGTHLNRSTYHRHLKRACMALKIDCSAHSARKLYAWNIFELSENIFDVKNALQHEYITTTAAYLDVDIVQLINSELRSRKKEFKPEL
jgi:integrase